MGIHYITAAGTLQECDPPAIPERLRFVGLNVGSASQKHS